MMVIATMALACLPMLLAEPVPLRGGRAAMEFELAAREMRRADEEIKAAAWDEENSGRTPAVDAAVADLAREARNVAQVTAQVVAEVKAQPEKKAHLIPTKATNTAMESTTDAAVQAIHQHQVERKNQKKMASTTDAAVKAIQQHSRERQHREAMNSAADDAIAAISRHARERSGRDDIGLATDVFVHGVSQNSNERAVADATKSAADLVRQHLEQQKDELEQDSDEDESTFQDLAQDA
jgi:hypothetical protein